MTVRSSSVRPRLLLGLLLGTLTLGVSAPQASANPLLEALPGGSIINSVLGGQSRQAPLPPPNLDLGSDNVRNNNLNLCVVSCGGALPGGVLPSGGPVPPQARPLPPIPQGRPPVPSRGPVSRPAAPSSPTPTLVVPPIPIRL